MEIPPKADFAFLDFTVNAFNFKEPKEAKVEISVGFHSVGILYTPSGKYNLHLKLTVFSDEQKINEIINADILAMFKFKEVRSKEHIPEHFYSNSIAIVFPYIRAFISNLTTQANWNPLILPLLNLSGLAKELKANTGELTDETSPQGSPK